MLNSLFNLMLLLLPWQRDPMHTLESCPTKTLLSRGTSWSRYRLALLSRRFTCTGVWNFWKNMGSQGTALAR